MLVLRVIQAYCAASVQSAATTRAQRFRGAMAHSSRLGSRPGVFVEAASGRGMPRGGWYASVWSGQRWLE
jgi:hypothetical protein